MKKLFISSLLSICLLLLASTAVFAHPGNTASDGCHYCRTRCDYWGVPWNERHCHGGGFGSTYEPPPSCPLFSTHNNLSDACECWSGYIASGNSCISDDQWCQNKLGFNSRYNSLSSSCECSYGYIFNGNTCVSTWQYCTGKYGYNSEYDVLSKSCKCRYGYVWNSTATQCISEDEACQNQFGYNSKATLSGDKCECKYGYMFNKAGTKCITRNAACQELNGLMSEYNVLTNRCECLSGYEYDGSQCVLKERPVFIIPTIKPTQTPKPTIAPKPTKKIEITVTPVEVKTTKSNLPQTEQKISLVLSFWQRLLQFFRRK